jgi:hypothetical protein
LGPTGEGSATDALTIVNDLRKQRRASDAEAAVRLDEQD